jgi:GNAT superfamily N-acetyltransferase
VSDAENEAKTKMLIRSARSADAEAACGVLRRSIAELCAADHRDDPQTVRRWLANKTPENVRAWIHSPTQRMLVACEGSAVLGVGSASDAGEILLNYVSPDARFRGVSKAILAALENYMRERRRDQSRLTSTLTAHGFYLAQGYADAAEPEEWAGMRGQPMIKIL